MSKFFSCITQIGLEKIAAASAKNSKLSLTQMVVGDGNGNAAIPSSTHTKLVQEVWRGALNSLSLDPVHPNHILAECVIPATVGGFWIREVGLLDAEGVLIAVGNLPDSYKPQLTEGSVRTHTIRMVIMVNEASAISFNVDDSTTLAHRDFVENAFHLHEKSRHHPEATLTEKGFVQLVNTTGPSEKLIMHQKAVSDELAKHQAEMNHFLRKTNNLSDLSNKEESRTNLDVHSKQEVATQVIFARDIAKQHADHVSTIARDAAKQHADHVANAARETAKQHADHVANVARDTAKQHTNYVAETVRNVSRKHAEVVANSALSFAKKHADNVSGSARETAKQHANHVANAVRLHADAMVNSRATVDFVNRTFVRDIRLGPLTSENIQEGIKWSESGGSSVIPYGGGRNGGFTTIYRPQVTYKRAIQKNVNGTWFNVGLA